MPRGSMPGERRGGRKLKTPNRRSILTDRILALAAHCTEATWTEFLQALSQDKAVPADTRVAILRTLSTRSGRKRGGPAQVGPTAGSSPSGRNVASRAGQPLTRLNRQQLEGLLRVIQDDSATQKDRRKAASAAALLLLPAAKDQKKWGSLEDKFGIAINPAHAREYRDFKLRLEALGKSGAKATPIVRVEIRKLKARTDEILKRCECPCPSLYGIKQISEDEIRLNRFRNKRKRGETLTKEEDAEEAHRQLRFDLYEKSPEPAARRRRKLLADFESQDYESRKEANPICMPPHIEFVVRLLRLLYPDPEPLSSTTDHSFHDEFMANCSGFENAIPHEDGNIYGNELPVETASIAADGSWEEDMSWATTPRRDDDQSI